MVDQRSVKTAGRHLEIMREIGGDLVDDRVNVMEKVAKKNPSKRVSSVFSTPLLKRTSNLSWEYDYLDPLRATSVELDEAEKLFALSKWLLSSEGIQ